MAASGQHWAACAQSASCMQWPLKTQCLLAFRIRLKKSVLPHWAAGRVNSGHSTTASQHHSTMAAGQQAGLLAKSLGKVFNNVIHMLNANGEPDRIGQNARFGQFCLGEL